MPPYGVRRGCGAKRRLLGRLIAAPTGARATVSCCRGALYMRPGRTAGLSGPSVTAVRSWRRGGMPPYGGRRGSGGKCRLFGRICNPPLQVRSIQFPAVGAHYICARTAPPGPARSAKVRQETEACSGGYTIRPYGCTRAGSRCRGALYMRPGCTAGTGAVGGVRRKSQCSSGGHKGRPYGRTRGRLPLQVI